MKEWARISPEQIQLPSTHPQHLLHKISATPGNDESKGLGRNGLDALLALDFHHLVQARTKNIFREWMLREKKIILPDQKVINAMTEKKFLFKLWDFSQFSHQTSNKAYK